MLLCCRGSEYLPIYFISTCQMFLSIMMNLGVFSDVQLLFVSAGPSHFGHHDLSEHNWDVGCHSQLASRSSNSSSAKCHFGDGCYTGFLNLPPCPAISPFGFSEVPVTDISCILSLQYSTLNSCKMSLFPGNIGDFNSADVCPSLFGVRPSSWCSDSFHYCA